jgi:hypothetical protein
MGLAFVDLLEAATDADSAGRLALILDPNGFRAVA